MSFGNVYAVVTFAKTTFIMTFPFFLLSALLIVFSALALIDGIYLHLIRFKLYRVPEAKFEHVTHTLRAILFPAILYFLMIQQQHPLYFYFGCAAVVLDVLVLGVDAYVEKDSRQGMGGLPRWEYILHLFVNGFHFAALAVFFVLKINYSADLGFQVKDLRSYRDFAGFSSLLILLLPGAIVIALAHIAVIFPRVQALLEAGKGRLKCC